MARLAVVATIEVLPGRRDSLLTALMAHRARCLKDEPGTLEMEVLEPLDDPTKVLVYEAYLDRAAFDLHVKGPSLAQFRRQSADAIAKFAATRCAVLDDESLFALAK
jgi:(4S)-4-hydroxy-5-phosphonooxypentane-2,3-dione isomerase